MGPPPASTRAWRAWRLAAGAIEPRLVPVTLKHPKRAKRRLSSAAWWRAGAVGARPFGDRQAVRVRRLLARVGIITVAATRWSPRRAVVVAVVAPERRGGTNEIAVSDPAVHTNRSAGRALQRTRATAMTMPTTEKTPVTTANPANGIVSPPSGTSKSTPTAWASAAARVVATIAASAARRPVTASPRSRWVWLVWPDARPATTPLSFMLFMSFLLIRSLAYGCVAWQVTVLTLA